jgi:hypothetical protein
MAQGRSTLTSCVVEPDGSAVRLTGLDQAGSSFVLSLSIDQVGSLAMTLPAVLERAVRARFRDDSLRYVYRLGGWTLEAASDVNVLILNLSTEGGFKASFGLPRSIVGELADALAEEQASGPRLTLLSN